MRPAPEDHGSAARQRPDDHPIQRRGEPDNNGVRSLPIPPPTPASPAEPADTTPADIHLVEAGRAEKADHQQQRWAFHGRCTKIAYLLANIESLDDRVQFYRMGAVSRLELTTAAALCPDLMPKRNDEWEWIALTLADNEDV